MADSWIWGMLMWPVQMDVARSAVLSQHDIYYHEQYLDQQAKSDKLSDENKTNGLLVGFHFPPSMNAAGSIVGIPLSPFPTEHDLLYAFFHALADIYPCGTCRESYGYFSTHDPPENSPNILMWVWELKNKVNRKLHRDGSAQSLPLEKFEKRLRIISSFSSVDHVWDLLSIFAQYYPDIPPNMLSTTTNTPSSPAPGNIGNSQHTTDNEDEIIKVLQRRRSYFILLAALSVFLGRLKTHHTLKLFLDPMTLTAEDIASRDQFVSWIVRQRQKWADYVGNGLACSLAETKNRYGNNNNSTSPHTTAAAKLCSVQNENNSNNNLSNIGYTCPNPALLPSGIAPPYKPE